MRKECQHTSALLYLLPSTDMTRKLKGTSVEVGEAKRYKPYNLLHFTKLIKIRTMLHPKQMACNYPGDRHHSVEFTESCTIGNSKDPFANSPSFPKSTPYHHRFTECPLGPDGFKSL
ncbi:hypothetical protein RJZ56_002154 [Blastomyces dermatitidis]|uniref:Uncharacterized protein n=2 Tax=Blastomyces TaxID=229219 RepID=A0A179UIU3_BLAGS|nr:uncharacterized protein BDBG_03821 [Blastomyces gilchristii SLH14081]XP_045274382.1 uncharacterized protein BDCG_02071 [Blastomyces dermatitidis ER-3]EEQ86951.1 hypothetical protein BDCG_02071 [Blastomyces dermatitidis ER-3]EQL30794.1 hypothetical protein BDFG_06819 [Blastomyces dermatitidis ATCC 26199]OAT07790.1 hypothetical protein BDBG_03821 [Blastomyces gilchristii SLH14081]